MLEAREKRINPVNLIMRQASVPCACGFACTELQLQMGSDHWAMGRLLPTEPCWKEQVMLGESFYVISGLGYDSGGGDQVDLFRLCNSLQHPGLMPKDFFSPNNK